MPVPTVIDCECGISPEDLELVKDQWDQWVAYTSNPKHDCYKFEYLPEVLDGSIFIYQSRAEETDQSTSFICYATVIDEDGDEDEVVVRVKNSAVEKALIGMGLCEESECTWSCSNELGKEKKGKLIQTALDFLNNHPACFPVID